MDLRGGEAVERCEAIYSFELSSRPEWIEYLQVPPLAESVHVAGRGGTAAVHSPAGEQSGEAPGDAAQGDAAQLRGSFALRTLPRGAWLWVRPL